MRDGLRALISAAISAKTVRWKLRGNPFNSSLRTPCSPNTSEFQNETKNHRVLGFDQLVSASFSASQILLSSW